MQQSQGGQFRLDPAVGEYVARVGQKMADVSDRDLPYEFVVLNNGVPNAWALPGGKIAINRGLLLEMDSEAELAAVLGHEVVHAAAKHSVRQMQRGMLLQALVVGTAVVTSDSDYGQLAAGAANVGASLLTSAYSRDAERDAERRLGNIDKVSFSYFTAKDVVRHPLVAAIIEAYDADEAS